MNDNERTLLLRTAQRWFEENNALDQRVAAFRQHNRQHADAWQAMADMGWLALTLPESAGGFAAGKALSLELIQLAGQHARPEALDMHLMLAPAIAQACPQQAEALATGDMRLGAADFTQTATGDIGKADKHEALTGRSGPLLGAFEATHYVLFVHHPSSPMTVALVRADAHGISMDRARFLDKRDTGLVTFCGTPALWLDAAQLGVTPSALRDSAAAALVADAAGVLQSAFDMTLAYLKQRIQFGAPLSSLQAVQHKMADLFCDVQQSSALTETLGAALDVSADGESALLPVAKAFVGRRILRALGQLIQLSGGIGVTEEYTLTHLYRRAHVAATLFGGVEMQLRRIDIKDTLLTA